MKVAFGRVTFAAGFSLCAGLCVLVPACGSVQHDYDFTPNTPEQTAPTPEPPIPTATVRQFEECTRDGAGRLNTYSHEIRFDIEVTPEGDVTRVKLRNSTLDDSEIESCLMRAVGAMSLPESALRLRSTEPFSGGERMRHSREPLGIAQAAGGLIAVGPIIIIAAGVTLGVYVGAVVVDEVVEAVNRRRRYESMCWPHFVECRNDDDQPDWNQGDFGTKKDCLSCLQECKHERGQWPDYKCPRSGYRPN